MVTYKLFRIKSGKLYPLYIEYKREMLCGIWLDAAIGPIVDETHVKGRCGPLRLRPGFHSTFLPFTDWIGKKGPDGKLYQRNDTVWCRCEVEGREEIVTNPNGLTRLPQDWYFFKTNVCQKDPWIISNRLFVHEIISQDEVKRICAEHGITAQPTEDET